MTPAVAVAVAVPDARRRHETQREFIARKLREDWWTVGEIARMINRAEPWAWHLVKELSTKQALVRRQRRHAFKKPYEYRTLASLPHAVDVRVP